MKLAIHVSVTLTSCFNGTSLMRFAYVSLTLVSNQMMKEFANVMLKITLFGMGKIASVILTKDSLMTDKVVVNVQKIHLFLIL